MSEQPFSELDIEEERYELFEEPAWGFALPRRDFLRTVGTGLFVVLTFRPSGLGQERPGRRRRQGRGMPSDISAWLHIDEKSAITVYTGKAEVGQDIRTSLTQVVAEELRAPPGTIRMVIGDTARVPYDRGTFGSRTTPVMAAHLRRMGAAAREMLIDLAAAEWKVERPTLAVAEGRVVHAASGRSAAFGSLTKGRKLTKTVGDGIKTTPPDQWTVTGRSLPKVSGRDIVTGGHRYASDIQRPGMLYGKVLRPAAFKATLASVDTSKAQAMAGVTVVREGSFIAVAASDELMAARALEAIDAKWTVPDQPSHEEIFEYLKKHPVQGRGRRARRGRRREQSRGSMDEGLAQAAHKLSASYTVAYIAHTPLEPRTAVAEWKDGRLTVWTGTQRPFGVRDQLKRAFGLTDQTVRVIVPDTGSGYGGKHTVATAIEAARLAQAARRPVKVVWTREEEFTWAYFRPAGLIEVTGGVGTDGRLTAWEFHNWNSGGSAIRPPYEIPNQKTAFHRADSPLSQGSYRALSATANHFARESHVDDLAQAVKLDPLEFRLRNLKHPRLRAVLEAATSKFGWGRSSPAKGSGFGLAVGTEKGGYVATCAEIAVEKPRNKVKVKRLVIAFECGAIVNPDGLRNQVEGCAVMGLGGALFEEIRFKDGRILNPHLESYRVPRFGDMPVIETVLLDRKDLPSAGAGEAPIVCIAPAIGNAIFDATGIRLRSLPLVPNGLPG